MQELMREYLNELKIRRKKRKRTNIAVVLLVVLVVSAVGNVLVQYGVAMTSEATCGIGEHVHDESCYQELLVCGQVESAGHTHDASCYQIEQVLVCGQEESELHLHDASCYAETQNLVCGQEESAGHLHDASCYTQQVICGLQEHQHTEVCYADTVSEEEQEDTDSEEEAVNEEDSEEDADEEEKEDEEEDAEEKVIELTTEVDGTMITLSGPESSFEEGREYSIQAEAIPETDEKIETIETALEQVAEEKAKKVDNYQAFDIKLMADGEEVQPLGPVEVKFSGQEVAQSVEDEATEVNVIHVDENTGEATDMEATATEEKEVVIETEHFSVYVYVHLVNNLFGKVPTTIQHWAYNFTAIQEGAEASAPNGTDTVFNTETSRINTQQIKTEIYSPTEMEIPNEYYTNVEELSKLCKVEADKQHYKVEKIWVTTDESNATRVDGWPQGSYQEYWLDRPNKVDGQDQEDIEIKIEAADHCWIRFWYKPVTKQNALAAETKFYDYDITDGNTYDKSGNIVQDGTGKYLKSEEKGINASGNFTSSDTIKRLGVGQFTSGNISSWSYDATLDGKSGSKLCLNRRATVSSNPNGVLTGIVGETLVGGKDGTLQYNVTVPKNLFSPGIGSTEYTNYQLQFNQDGDTYTLQSVKDSVTGGLVEDNLTNFDKYPKYGGGFLYSNNFWPMDFVPPENRKDPLMKESGRYGAMKDNGVIPDKPINVESISGNDDANDPGAIAHNWHFGMVYSVKFTVGDYTGPMQYYFRGDDDFWMFLDGKKIVDIGGIHGAAGHLVDLKEELKKQNNGTVDTKTEHVLKIFYMERGGFGSCCYMQFTLPQAGSVEVEPMETTTYDVTKTWDDGDNPFRPTSIKIELQQVDQGKVENTGTIVDLTAANNWTHHWEGLPKMNGSTQGQYEYTYQVREVELPPGYVASIDDNGNLKNTLEKVKVKVTKNWENDAGVTEKYRPDSVRVRLYANGNPYEVNGQYWEADLNAGNNWSVTFNDLPEYCNYNYVWDAEAQKYSCTCDKVQYSVRELNGNTVLEEGGKLDGKSGSVYQVSYGGGMLPEKDTDGYVADLQVTNTLFTSFKIVKKGSQAGTHPLQGAEFELLPYSEEENGGEAGDTENDGMLPTPGTPDAGENGAGTEGNLLSEMETNPPDMTLTGSGSEGAGETKPLYRGISDENGVINWKTLEGEPAFIANGKYLMRETIAPAGYTLSTEEWILTVSGENGKIRALIQKKNEEGVLESVEAADTEVNGEEILVIYEYYNQVVYELPSTGGPGIYWYVFGGALLMLAATLMTYKNKRRGVLKS